MTYPILKAKIDWDNLKEKNFILEKFLDDKPLNATEIFNHYREMGEYLKPLVGNVSLALHDAHAAGEKYSV